MSWNDLILQITESYTRMSVKDRRVRIMKVIKTKPEKKVLKKWFPELYKEVLKISTKFS